MKNFALIILGVLSLSSFCFAEEAELKDHYFCKSADEQIQLRIEAKNCPEFQIDSYDSITSPGCKNPKSFEAVLFKNNQYFDGRIQIISSQGGVKYQTVEGFSGKACITGSVLSGFKVTAILSNVGARQQVSEFECSSSRKLPQSAYDCNSADAAGERYSNQ